MKLPYVPFGSRELRKQKPLLKGTDVRCLQQALKRMGFHYSRVDGVFGDDTARSVRMFQKAFGRKPTGIADAGVMGILEDLIRAGIGRWLTLQRDFAHTGFSPVPLPHELEISAVKKIPGIMGLSSRDGILVAAAAGLYALDLKSGGTVWHNRDLLPRAAVSLQEADVYVPAKDLVVVDLYTGRVKRRINAGEFTYPVAAKDGRIYAPDGGAVCAFDEEGSVLWRFKTGGALCSTPALGFDLVYFTSYDHYIYSLDEQGVPYWKTKTPDIIKYPVSIWGSMVFAVSLDMWFYALNPLSGEIIWKKKFSDEEFMMPVFHRDFMLAVDAGGTVFAISPQRAEIKWVKEFKTSPTTHPVICPKTAFFGNENGLVALDLSTGEFKLYLEGKKVTALAISRFNLYAATENELVIFSPVI